MLTNSELISIVIPVFNGQSFVEQCLNSILQNVHPNFEVIIIDDGSAKSIKLAKKFCDDKRIKLFRNETNQGPARARNIGIKLAKGQFIMFLDIDTKVDPLCLVECVKVLSHNKTIGACQSKILRLHKPHLLDDGGAGSLFTSTGFIQQRGMSDEVDRGQYDKFEEIFCAKSAALMIKREVLDEIGLFDEDYYMYVEDTDLCWRVWLRGYRVVFVPNSLVFHAFGSTGRMNPQQSHIIKYYGTRNYIMTLIKNLGIKNLVLILPRHIMIWSAVSMWFMVRRELSDALLVIKGVLWNVENFKRILTKRRKIQSNIRRLPDSVIMPRVMRKLGSAYLRKRFSNLKNW